MHNALLIGKHYTNLENKTLFRNSMNLETDGNKELNQPYHSIFEIWK